MLNLIDTELNMIIAALVLVCVFKILFNAIMYQHRIRQHYNKDLNEGDRILDLYYSEVKEKNIKSIEEIIPIDEYSSVVSVIRKQQSTLLLGSTNEIRIYIVAYYIGIQNLYNEVYLPHMESLFGAIKKKNNTEYQKIKKEKLERKLLKRRRTLINSLEPRKKKNFF